MAAIAAPRVALTSTTARRAMSTTTAAKLRTPVLIVGGGPVGLYASALLSGYGVPSLLVERSAAPSAHPRSHLINTRSMELLRGLGVEGAVRAQTPPLDEWRHFRYCSSLLGAQFGAQDHMAGAEWAALRGASPTEMAHLSQPKLSAILRAEALRRAPAAGASLLSGYELVGLEQDATGVRAELRRCADADGGDAAAVVGGAPLDLAAAAPAALTVSTEHALGCDGARSSVRRALGLALEGPPTLQRFKSVHFRAPKLGDALRAAGRNAMLYFFFHPAAIGVLVAHNIGEGEWVAQLPYYPQLQDEGELHADACAEIIAQCIGGGADGGGVEDGGGGGIEVDVRSVSSWAMNALVATRFSAGHCHILGDAAHQFPPAGAFGANTGLQDAHNLAWKIALVHRGAAPAALLRTYDGERRAVAIANARLSVHNYHRGLRVAHALGLPAAVPREVDAALREVETVLRAPSPLMQAIAESPWGALLPNAKALVRETGDTLLAAGRQRMLGSLVDADADGAPTAAAGDPTASMRAAAAARVIESGAALPLLFPRHELGFAYDDASAAATAPPPADDADADGAAPPPDPDIEDEAYAPSTAAGARLPHHWLASGDDAAEVSTLDLLAAADGAPRCALFVAADGAAPWLAAARALPPDAAPHVVVVRPPDGGGGETAAEGVEVRVVRDASGGWAEKRQVGAGGALLVRPDGHVAWRCRAADGPPAEAEAAAQLEAALTRALRRA